LLSVVLFCNEKEPVMLRWALFFLLMALAAALFAYTGVARDTMEFARILFFLFLIFFFASLSVEWRRRRGRRVKVPIP